MAAATVQDGDTTLLEMAARCDQQADELYERVRALRVQAAQYRVEASRADRHVDVLPFVQARTREAISEQSLDKMVDSLRALQPCSVGALAEHQGITTARATGILKRLEELQVADRTGLRSATRWFLKDERPEGVKNTEQKVRDALVKLGQFTRAELGREASVSDSTVLRYLKQFMENGQVTVEIVNGTHVYTYEPPAYKKAERRQHQPAELQVVDRTQLGTAPKSARKRTATRGTAARKLLRDIEAAGGRLDTSGGQGMAPGHFKVRDKDGRVVGGFNKRMTEGAVKSARDALRNNGLDV